MATLMANAKKMIARTTMNPSALSPMRSFLVTEAPYVPVTGVSGSLQNPHPGDYGWPRVWSRTDGWPSRLIAGSMTVSYGLVAAMVFSSKPGYGGSGRSGSGSFP